MYNCFIKNISTTLKKIESGEREVFDENYYFGEVYQDYDNFLEWDERAVDLIERFGCQSFLDVGCGCGNLVKEVKRQTEEKRKRDCDVQGVDSSKFAVKKASAAFVTWADCRALPFNDGRFDLVYILTTFSYLDDKEGIEQAIKEAYRVARKVVVFDDVYVWPKKDSFDYDPYRKLVWSKEQWMAEWRKVMGREDRMTTYEDEIIIRRGHE